MDVAGLVDLRKPLAGEQLEGAEDEPREEPKRLRKTWTRDDPKAALCSQTMKQPMRRSPRSSVLGSIREAP